MTKKCLKNLQAIVAHNLLQACANNGIIVLEVKTHKFVTYNLGTLVSDITDSNIGNREVLEVAKLFANHPRQLNKLNALL